MRLPRGERRSGHSQREKQQYSEIGNFAEQSHSFFLDLQLDRLFRFRLRDNIRFRQVGRPCVLGIGTGWPIEAPRLRERSDFRPLNDCEHRRTFERYNQDVTDDKPVPLTTFFALRCDYWNDDGHHSVFKHR